MSKAQGRENRQKQKPALSENKPGLEARRVATRLLGAVVDARSSLDALTDSEHGHPQYVALEPRDRALVRARCVIAPETLATGDRAGTEVRDSIILANEFAEMDPYRATTHNKGIMNGIDAVAIATGNDWRAIEAADMVGEHIEFVVDPDHGDAEGPTSRQAAPAHPTASSSAFATSSVMACGPPTKVDRSTSSSGRLPR